MATRIPVNASERLRRLSQNPKTTLFVFIVLFALAVASLVTTDSPSGEETQAAVAQQIK